MNPSILIVTAPYYREISDMLEQGARNTLEQAGYASQTITVPGAFEIPAAISFAAQSRRFEGYVALGCVIRGETTHYDYVCGESARGLAGLALREHLAIGYGILTVETMEQAHVRADVKQGNKGGEAAKACLQMLALKQLYGVA
jgi:6,7-dimethyl-8-ribityllumazine synthase